MALLYNVGLCIFLLHLVINIAVSSRASSRSFLNIVGLLIIVGFVGNTFCGLFIGLGSPTSAFFFYQRCLIYGPLDQ